MAIKIEIFEMPKSTYEYEASAEQILEITKRVQRSNRNLQKKMRAIKRKEAEAWKNSYRRG